MIDSNQYDACMGIMVRLSVDQLAELRADFICHEDGLTLDQFVFAMLKRLTWKEQNAVDLVRDLIELFAQVDVNGDETMEWEEFTNFIIEAGMGEMVKLRSYRDYRYQEDAKFTDQTTRHPRLLQYYPEIRKLIALDADRPIIQVYDPTSYFTDYPFEQRSLSLLNEFSSLTQLAGHTKDSSDSTRSVKSPVQCLLYLNKLEVFVVSTGDLSLSFWSYAMILSSEAPTPIALIGTEHAQRKLAWSAHGSRLYSIDTTLAINVWSVAGNSKHIEVGFLYQLLHHEDLIQDLLLVNDTTLASCGMDNYILLWDSLSNELKSTRIGHKRGVQTLERCSDILFVSAGYEFEIFGWDASGLSTSPIFRLWGHTSPLIQLHSIASKNQIISLDQEGWFRWWDIQQSVPIEDSERCLQAFQISGSNSTSSSALASSAPISTAEEYTWKPNSFAVLNEGSHIVAAGYKLKLLQLVRKKSKTMPSCIALYNSVSFTILTTTDKDVRIWDVISGKLLREYLNISASEITQIQLDRRQRKFVLGNQAGELLVFDYLNGVQIKSFPRHQADISCVVYAPEDKCVLTSSWDRSVRVYDDDDSDPMLRCIYNAHEADIGAMAFSYVLSLIATASSDGVIRVWDFVYLAYEGECHPTPETAATALTFFEPYPLLISAHEDGQICLWYVRPWKPIQQMYSMITSLPNSISDHPILSLATYYQYKGGEEIDGGITTGSHFLMVGDDDGVMRIWNLTRLLSQIQMKAFPEARLPHKIASYNPRRRVMRDGRKIRQTKLQQQLKLGVENEARDARPRTAEELRAFVTKEAEWKAHTQSIRTIQLLDKEDNMREDDPYKDEDTILMTCSTDKSVSLWSLTGVQLGVLCNSGNENLHWNVHFTKALKQQQEHERAVALWERIQPQVAEMQLLRKKRLKSTQMYRRTAVGATEQLVSNNLLQFLYHQQSTQELQHDLDKHKSSERTRLFQQLHGDETWKKSTMELATEKALEKAKEKFTDRMNQLTKRNSAKAKSKASRDDRLEYEDENDSTGGTQLNADYLPEADSIAGTKGGGASQQMLFEFPDLPSNQLGELPFEAEDNWTVNSLNRQRLLYPSLYKELQRNQLVAATADPEVDFDPLTTVCTTKGKRTKMHDISPSQFLLEKLGPDKPVLKQLRPRRKSASSTKSLEQSKSMSALPPRHVSTTDSSSPLPGLATSASTANVVMLAPITEPDSGPLSSIDRLQKRIQQVHKRHQQLAKLPPKVKKSSNQASPKKTKKGRKASTIVRTKPKAQQLRMSVSTSGPGAKAGRKNIRYDMQLLKQKCFGSYSREEIVNVLRLFAKLDADNSGNIELDEFLSLQSQMPSAKWMEENLHSIFKSIDQDGSGSIDRDELLCVIFPLANSTVLAQIKQFAALYAHAQSLKAKKKRVLSPRTMTEIKDLFRLYDVDGSGGIDASELLKGLEENQQFYNAGGGSHQPGCGWFLDDIIDLLREFDMDDNATLDLDEFIELFREVF